MRLIGINGRLRSGKDTAYEIIAAAQPKVARAAFADKLKLSAATALGFDIDRDDPVGHAVMICNALKGDAKITTTWDSPTGSPHAVSITGRQYLQIYGTEAHRDVFDTDFWVNALLPATGAPIDAHFPGTDILVVTDVRFDNEAARILDLGGEVWKIDADARLGPLPADAHSSEHGVSPQLVTRVVDNNGTPRQYQINVLHALHGFGEDDAA